MTRVLASLALMSITVGCSGTPVRLPEPTTAPAPSVLAARPSIFIAGNSTAARGAGARQQG